MCIRKPKTATLIFTSGNIVITRAKSEDGSMLVSREDDRNIQKLGFNRRVWR